MFLKHLQTWYFYAYENSKSTYSTFNITHTALSPFTCANSELEAAAYFTSMNEILNV